MSTRTYKNSFICTRAAMNLFKPSHAHTRTEDVIIHILEISTRQTLYDSKNKRTAQERLVVRPPLRVKDVSTSHVSQIVYSEYLIALLHCEEVKKKTPIEAFCNTIVIHYATTSRKEQYVHFHLFQRLLLYNRNNAFFS